MTEEQKQSINKKISFLFNKDIKIDSIVSDLLKTIENDYSHKED